MAAQLPDEILMKIIRACITPYQITIVYIDASEEFNIVTGEHSDLMSVKLVNKMFHDEIRLGIDEKFNGFVLLRPGSSARDPRLLHEYVMKVFNPTSGELGWAAKRATCVGMLRRGRLFLSKLDLGHFTNLREVRIAFNDIIVLPGYSRDWRRHEILAGKNNSTLEMFSGPRAYEIMCGERDQLVRFREKGIQGSAHD